MVVGLSLLCIATVAAQPLQYNLEQYGSAATPTRAGHVRAEA